MDSTKHINRRGFLAATGIACAAAHTASAAPTYTIGCYTRPWSAYDYRVALDAIAEAGFKHAGLMTTNSESKLVISEKTTLEEASKVGEECKQRGLSVPSTYGGGIPLSSIEDAVAGMKRLIDNCEASGTANLLMGGTGNADVEALYYKAIQETCGYAADKGIGISVKPHGGLNATGLACRKHIEEVGHKNFRIWYDPGNIYYYSDSKREPAEDLKDVDGLVCGMCVKDFVLPKEVMITPGDGQVDFPAVMAGLRRGGFNSGALVIECLKPGDLKETLAEAKRARKFVEEFIAALT